MSGLITIKPASIGGNQTETVSGRELHAALGVGTDFGRYFKRRISECGYAQGIDFLVKSKNASEGFFGAREVTDDYLLTTDMAKELCMLERSDKGRQFRRYFIAREREAIEKGRHLEALAKEVLARNPLWSSIHRYASLPLNNVEIGKLCGCCKDTVRRERRSMEACGLLQPPENLAKMQQMALRLPSVGGAS